MAIADGLFDYAVEVPGGFSGGVLHDVPYIRTFLQRPDLSLVNVQDGLLFFERGHQSENLLQSVKSESIETTPDFTHIFNGSIGLVNCSVKEIRDGVYQFKFTWKLTQAINNYGPLIAVSKLIDLSTTNVSPNMRILHIPSEVLLPTTEWKLDELVIETFDVLLPSNLAAGTYQISTSWYNSNNIYSFLTDTRVQFGDQWIWGNISVP